METKHTKGEWNYRKQGSFNGYYIESVNDDFIGETGGGIMPDEEILANSKLIAAAPNLLAALSELHDLAMDGYDSHVKSGTHEEFLKEDREVLKNALKAIKKAIE